MPRRLFLLLVAALSFALSPVAPVGAASTTIAKSALIVYDAPATTSNADHGRSGLSDTPWPPGSQEGSASVPTAPRGTSTTPSGAVVATNSSDVLLNSSKQLQSKFKHAGDFGVTGNYSKANAAKHSEALNQHINSPAVTKISGTYRGNPVTHHLDPATGLNVIVDPSGAFISGWKLGPEQLQNVLSHGGLT